MVILFTKPSTIFIMF